MADKSSTIITDELPGYRGVGPDFDGGHLTVNHRRGEYVRKEQCGDVIATTNNAESYFATLKRAHYVTRHKMSVKHLGRYVDECVFTWNTRKLADGQRIVEAIEGADRKRLLYRLPAVNDGTRHS